MPNYYSGYFFVRPQTSSCMYHFLCTVHFYVVYDFEHIQSLWHEIQNHCKAQGSPFPIFKTLHFLSSRNSAADFRRSRLVFFCIDLSFVALKNQCCVHIITLPLIWLSRNKAHIALTRFYCNFKQFIVQIFPNQNVRQKFKSIQYFSNSCSTVKK